MLFQLALLSLLASVASSQSRYTYGAGKWAPGGGGLLANEFDDLLVKEADAEGRYTLGGRNVSKTYEETSRDPSPGWSLTVSTKADISIPRSNQTFTGARIALEVPDAKNMDVTWQLCVLEWRPDPDDYPAALRQDDGMCSKAVSDECRFAIEAAAIDKYMVTSGNTACVCPSISNITACGGADAKKLLTGGGACQARTFNATRVRDWPDGKFTVLQYGGRAQDPGNRTDYDQVGSIAWPVLVMWGHSRAQLGAGSFEIRNTAQLACVRARNATSVSKLGAPNPKNGAGGRMVPELWMIGLSVVVVLVSIFL